MDPMANKAPSDFDRAHIVNVMSSFDIPFGRDRRYGSEASRVVNGVFGDWEIALLAVWESGPRFSVTSGRETLFADVFSLADYSGSREIDTPNRREDGVYWTSQTTLNQFTIPEAGSNGSSGRNSFKGPKYLNFDVTFFKSFQIRDDNRLQIRFEFYNFFNRAQFGVPVTDISQSNFGQFTSMVGTPRRIQMALRYTF
jgi:hypothetical protein